MFIPIIYVNNETLTSKFYPFACNASQIFEISMNIHLTHFPNIGMLSKMNLSLNLKVLLKHIYNYCSEHHFTWFYLVSKSSKPSVLSLFAIVVHIVIAYYLYCLRITLLFFKVLVLVQVTISSILALFVLDL